MPEDLPKYCEGLPLPYKTAGYFIDGEGAWPREAALGVIEHLGRRRCAVIGVDIWVLALGGPRIPMPAVQDWDPRAERGGDSWDAYVQRMNGAASEYIRTFSWAAENAAFRLAIPFFNLCVECDEAT